MSARIYFQFYSHITMLHFGKDLINKSDNFPILRSEEHTSELQSRSDLVCRLLLEKKKLYGVNTFQLQHQPMFVPNVPDSVWRPCRTRPEGPIPDAETRASRTEVPLRTPSAFSETD